MSGNRYLLDTNAIIALLQGNQPLLQRLAVSKHLRGVADDLHFSLPGK